MFYESELLVMVCCTLYDDKIVEHSRPSRVGDPNVHVMILSCSRRRQSKGGDISMWQLRMVMDDIAYDYISYLIQMSSVLIDEPTFISIFTPDIPRASMRIYTIPFHTITLIYCHSAFLSSAPPLEFHLQVSSQDHQLPNLLF